MFVFVFVLIKLALFVGLFGFLFLLIGMNWQEKREQRQRRKLIRATSAKIVRLYVPPDDSVASSESWPRSQSQSLPRKQWRNKS